MTARGVAVGVAAWALYGVVYAAAVTAFADVPYRYVVVSQLTHAAILGGVGVLAWWMVVRWLAERPVVAILGAHVIGVALYVPVTLGLLWLSARAGGSAGGLEDNLGWIGVSTAIVYLAQVAVYHATEASRRARLRRAQSEAVQRLARDQELSTLRAQLNPHFLFNALNTISAEVGRDADAAREAIGRLADLLRYTLDAGRRDLVPLADELAFVRDYLALEGARMGDRLDARLDIDPAAEAVRLPPMAIQTLVENAVRHGLAPSRAGGRLTVSAQTVGDAVEVSVEDTGVGQRPGPAAPGIGLANTDHRLRLLFGPASALRIEYDRAVGFAVSFRLPADGAPANAAVVTSPTAAPPDPA